MNNYIYSLYDAATDKLIYKGTPTQLMEAGLYKSIGAPNAAWRSQINGAKPRRWRVEREAMEPLKQQKKPYRHKAKEEGCTPEAGKTPSPFPSADAARKRSCSKEEPFYKEKPSGLQQDVHWLCRYNAKARKLGKKELGYGMWSALGKPKEPV